MQCTVYMCTLQPLKVLAASSARQMLHEVVPGTASGMQALPEGLPGTSSMAPAPASDAATPATLSDNTAEEEERPTGRRRRRRLTPASHNAQMRALLARNTDAVLDLTNTIKSTYKDMIEVKKEQIEVNRGLLKEFKRFNDQDKTSKTSHKKSRKRRRYSSSSSSSSND